MFIEREIKHSLQRYANQGDRKSSIKTLNSFLLQYLSQCGNSIKLISSSISNLSLNLWACFNNIQRIKESERRHTRKGACKGSPEPLIQRRQVFANSWRLLISPLAFGMSCFKSIGYLIKRGKGSSSRESNNRKWQ